MKLSGNDHVIHAYGRSYRTTRRKQNQWHAKMFVLIALGVLAALWQVFNGSGWVKP